jgi:two-component system OmpR family sensor kinase
MDKIAHLDNLKKKYMTIEQIVNQEYSRFGFTNDLKKLIEDMNLRLIYSNKQIQKILNDKHLELIIKKRSENILLYIFKSDEDNILHFHTPFEEFIIIDKDIEFYDYNKLIIIIFLSLLFAILFIAYSVYKKLSPLNELQSKIDDIGDTDLSLDFLKKDAKDEVSLLAKSLLEKSQSIHQLKTSRDVFIRNIMHELKTPITKGRFLTELPNTQINKEKLQKVFYQLESLISEFAIIEEVIAKKETIVKKDIFFDDILENVLDLLMLEDETIISTNANNTKLHVNFKLFSIVIKNLIDNAIKYSKEQKVTIQIEHDSISVSNIGKPLQYDLESYYEPFFNNNQHKSNQKESFGLGLYIVKNILDVHGFKLSYCYKNEKNIFTIKL